MLIYYFIFFLLCLYGFVDNFLQKSLKNFFLALLIIFLIFFIGTRFAVGGDYHSYMKYYYTLKLEDSYFTALFISGGDYLYNLLTVFFAKIGLQITSINFICATIFSLGIYIYAINQKYPALVLIVAFPYLILVVSMGYTRQATAIGLFLIALVALKNKKIIPFFFFIILASLFHKSAIILLFFAFLTSKKHRNIIFICSIILFVILFFVVLADDFFGVSSTYVVNQTFESRGAYIRAGINILAALIFFINYKKFSKENSYNNLSIYFWMSLASIIIFPMNDYASTAFDRLGLFLMPLQLFVFSNLFISIYSKINMIKYSIICAFYFCVLFVWLQFAIHSYLWIPYQSVLIPSVNEKYYIKNMITYRVYKHTYDNEIIFTTSGKL